jgi:hypothetical protein
MYVYQVSFKSRGDLPYLLGYCPNCLPLTFSYFLQGKGGKGGEGSSRHLTLLPGEMEMKIKRYGGEGRVPRYPNPNPDSSPNGTAGMVSSR